ncbi:MAG: hypothetical protein Ta2B_12350 [Termitinemataceae bacterium]|nr:MAG: hypothetical protein Ta2B_12350 [Termitinemataceae bacterium]
MVTIEQVKQLETRVSKVLDYAIKATDENTLLKSKLDSCQKRIDELEVLIQHFKDDQGKIEEGIVSALDRLNQFEDSVEKTLSPEKKSKIVSITKSAATQSSVTPAQAPDVSSPPAVETPAAPAVSLGHDTSVETPISIDPVASLSLADPIALQDAAGEVSDFETSSLPSDGVVSDEASSSSELDIF